ncbi:MULTISPECIES: hypothetical protein [Sphingobium]|uniref:Uncharacterized protein n=1 Tax=Sphingobium fuliginis (strain ATCC 27551) TaxID=336203 RepID=A0ABQ1ERD5_SPHSA|nr:MULTISPECIES: hypothetical protein [Sphingobium]RYL99310.1 hypothetical protein EWH10_05360 [Sphingobium fuliginis]WDA36873.1 hypothetical protein PO876_01255 [Sphingobium sp. YC-XJ3]GFZ83888.1 hypothetical protein GCM10019071_10720 [Sphingobium fuliginis]
MTGGVVLALALLQSATPAKTTASQLTSALETAFRACAQQLTERDHLTAKNEKLLKNVGITLAIPPADVETMASRLFGKEGIYASVAVPEGKMWLATSASVPACKVTLADTMLSLTARYDWTTKLRSIEGWTIDKSRSGMQGNFMRDLLVLNAERPGGHMIVILDGPNIVYNEGKGIQMIMTVALDAAKAQ